MSKRLLILKLEHIGDYILSLPTLKTLKKNFPKWQINIVVGAWNKQLAQATPYVDKVIIFNDPLSKRRINLTKKNYFYRFLSSFMMLFNLLINGKKILSFILMLRKYSYDTAISLSTKRAPAFYLGFIKSGVKLSGLKWRNTEENEAKKLLKIIRQLGIKKEYKISLSDLNIKKKYLKHVNNLINKYKLINKEMIVIHPFTPIKEKTWPIDNWITLINIIIKKMKNVAIVFIGSKKDSKKIKHLVSLLQNKDFVYNFAGKINLLETLILIDRTNLFLGCDSGPLHLAGITSTPIIALFGPTNPKIWGPVRKKNVVIIKEGNIASIKTSRVFKFIKEFIR